MFNQKILLPHQYYYPHIDLLRDRSSAELKKSFAQELDRNRGADTMLYVHFPFCDSKCRFCGFDKEYNLDAINGYVEKVIAELEYYAPYGFSINNIHFGGGSPSLIPPFLLARILAVIRKNYDMLPNAAINMEGSSTSLYQPEMIAFLLDENITRVSTGVQTFYRPLRDFFEIEATLEEVYLTLETLRKNNINVFVDILYGYPDYGFERTPKQIVEQDLKTAMRLDVGGIDYSHLYPMKNKLEPSIKDGAVQLPSTSELLAMMDHDMAMLEEGGYRQETSYGFVKRGDIIMETSYYGGEDNVSNCLAIGSGAFGLIGRCKYRNPLYHAYVTLPTPSYSQIKVLTDQQMNYMQIVGFPKVLRLNKSQFEHSACREVFLPKLSKLMEAGLLAEVSDAYVLTKKGRLYVDNIYYDLLDDAERRIVDRQLSIIKYD
jgi:coproporphyrinogen III oxidase-like Fe-S oxidoreductase